MDCESLIALSSPSTHQTVEQNSLNRSNYMEDEHTQSFKDSTNLCQQLMDRYANFATPQHRHHHRPLLQPHRRAPPPHVTHVLYYCHLCPQRLQGGDGPSGTLRPYILHGHCPPSHPAQQHRHAREGEGVSVACMRSMMKCLGVL